MLVLYKADLIIISLKINLFSPWYSWKIAELALNNNHSLTLLCAWLHSHTGDTQHLTLWHLEFYDTVYSHAISTNCCHHFLNLTTMVLWNPDISMESYCQYISLHTLLLEWFVHLPGVHLIHSLSRCQVKPQT